MGARYLYAVIPMLCFAISGFAQTPDRTGFYIGPNAGVSFNKFSAEPTDDILFYQISGVYVPNRGIVIVPGTTRPAPAGTSNKTGIPGGMQLGYRKQFRQWIAGIEGDFNFLSAKVQADVDDSLPATALQWSSPYYIHHTARVQMMESIRAKFGYALTSGLIYASAGVAFSSIKTTASDYYNSTTYWALPWYDNAPHPTPAQVRFLATGNSESKRYGVTGFTFGLGYEWFISPTFSLGIEYRHTGFSKSYATSASLLDTIAIDARPTYSGVLAEMPEKVSFKCDQLSVRLNMCLNPAQKNKKQKGAEKGGKR